MEIAQPAFDILGQAMQNALIAYGAITLAGITIASGVKYLANKFVVVFL